VGSLIITVTVGFLLGILLMFFLVAGRDEEDLEDRVEKAESSGATSSRRPDGAKEAAGNTHPEGIQPR
jgi:hypothetical protein